LRFTKIHVKAGIRWGWRGGGGAGGKGKGRPNHKKEKLVKKKGALTMF